MFLSSPNYRPFGAKALKIQKAPPNPNGWRNFFHKKVSVFKF
jgi:hypothetical protein